ncbi:MAG: Os1348 family NHLP clan protein [Gemmatimonadota bacterium]
MHKNVELLIGRLATDAQLRRRFAKDPGGFLRNLVERGFELTAVEVDAIASIDTAAITAFASILDRRLRHAASTTTQPGTEQ